MEAKTEQIYREFGDQLRRFILSRINDESLADDILQEVFIKVHTKIETVKDTTKLRGWIFRIARNTIIDFFRSKTNTANIPADYPYSDKTSQEQAREVLSVGIRAIIQLLPDKDREAILLTEYYGLTQKELANRLHLSLSGAKSRVQRARKKLKAKIMEYCHFEFDRRGVVVDYYPKTCSYCLKE